MEELSDEELELVSGGAWSDLETFDVAAGNMALGIGGGAAIGAAVGGPAGALVGAFVGLAVSAGASFAIVDLVPPPSQW